jgi:GNAT superfamily N-acetyltransferase
MPITTKRVCYDDPRDCENLVQLLGEYARLECGDDPPDLSHLPQQLANFPTAFSLLAYADSDQTAAVGLVNCFFGFSTFAGRSLVNVHDVIVTEKHRGKGVSGVMLEAVARIASEHDCCRVTLEVLADNTPALRAYQKQGFARDPAHPHTDIFFLRKSL